MLIAAYLCKSRHGVYYFRWPLPQLAGQPRRTLKLSLSTHCPKRASDLARYLASCGIVLKGNRTLARLRQDEIREKVRAYFKEHLVQYEDRLKRYGLSRNAQADAREEMLDHDCMAETESLYPKYVPIERFKRKMNISDTVWEQSMPRILHELRKGRRDMLKAVLEIAEQQESYSFKPEPETPALQTQAQAELPSKPIGESIDAFLSELISAGRPDGTIEQYGGYFNVLTEYFGADKPLAQITKQDATAVKDLLRKLPSSRNTKPALKNLPIREVVKVKGHKTIAPRTINSHLDTFARFFKWANNHGYTEHELFAGMKVAQAINSDTDRKAFTPEQLRQMLKELTDPQSKLVRKESHKWATLLGMFTGARQNELCQLDKADIKQDGAIWFINITDEGDSNKRVKAAASKRRVPIHSELIKLGFLDFYKAIGDREKLFPDYTYCPNHGYGRKLSRWFNEQFLIKLNMKKRGTDFHCLRTTMVTRLMQSGVEEPIVKGIVGHAREGVTQENYFREGYTLQQMKEALEKFRVE